MQGDLLRNFLVIRGNILCYIFCFSFIILCKILIYLCYSIACFSSFAFFACFLINSSVNIVRSVSNRSSITGSIQILYIFIFSTKTIINFLSGITWKSLNAFYYASSPAKADYSRFMNITASMAFRLVPDFLRTQPVFLCIDDTIVPNLGQSLKMFPSCLIMLLTGVLSTWTDTVLLAWCSAYRSGKRTNFLAFGSARLSYVDKAEIKTWTGSWHDPSGNAGMPETEKCHSALWQLVYEKTSGIHPRRISESGYDRKCTGRFCPVWSATGTDRTKRQTGRTWEPALHRNRFYFFW